VAATLLACSSSSGNGGGGSCPQVSPCGGDLTGKWTVSNACVTSSQSSVDGGCAGETEQIGSLSASGTVQFNSDKTYSTNVSLSVSATLSIPTSCLSSGGITLTCSQLQMSINTDAGTVSCNTSGSDCDCTLSETSATNETGGYTVSGDTLTTTPSGKAATTDTYCVQGNTLYIFPSGSSGTNEEIVLTMQ
jgi:hypothetical protein